MQFDNNLNFNMRGRSSTFTVGSNITVGRMTPHKYKKLTKAEALKIEKKLDKIIKESFKDLFKKHGSKKTTRKR